METREDIVLIIRRDLGFVINDIVQLGYEEEVAVDMVATYLHEGYITCQSRWPNEFRGINQISKGTVDGVLMNAAIGICNKALGKSKAN